MAELTDERAEWFCQEYIIDLKGAAAMRRIGFRGKRPDQAAQEYLRKPEIQDRIYELKLERSHRTRISQDRVVTELARVALADLHQIAAWDKNGVRARASSRLSPDDRAAVRSVKQRKTVRRQGEETVETVELHITLHDKVRALELLGKHVGLGSGDGGEGPGAPGAYLVGVPIAQPRDHAEWLELSKRHLAELQREKKGGSEAEG